MSSDSESRLNHKPKSGLRPESPLAFSSLNSRVPLFECVLLLVVVALGWTAYNTYEVLSRLEQPPGLKQEGRDIQDILKLQAMNDVKDRYAGLADQFEPALGVMRDALQNYIRDKDRAEIGRYLRRSQTLTGWLRKHQEDTDRRKLETLRAWIATLPAGGTNALVLDLDVMLNKAEQSYTNYLAAIGIAVEGQTLTPDVVKAKLTKASESEQELLSLAGQARLQSAAFGAFVERHSSEMAKQARVNEADLAGYVKLARNSLQPVLYALIIVLIVQCALLMVASYGRLVVAPLHQRLIENNTAVEHQRKLDHFARLATSLAHEIRNPLTAINVRLFTLQKNMNKGTSEHGDAALIRAEIDRLEQILKNFLKLARPSEPKITSLTAEPALREVRDLLTPQLQRQSIDLKLDSVTDATFQADPLQLKQVLINLIQNAADSIGRKGTITLRAKRSEARVSGVQSKTVVLEVEDTGGGIAPEVQERLFDPFFSTKENGTGLGLPIAAKIIDQHNGTLDFETQPGHGTTFRVVLPAAKT